MLVEFEVLLGGDPTISGFSAFDSSSYSLCWPTIHGPSLLVYQGNSYSGVYTE